MPILRALLFLAGAALVLLTLTSAVRTFVLPRAAPDALTGLVFRSARLGFNLAQSRLQGYRSRDRLMAFYAPVSLLLLLPTWLILVTLGYGAMYWGTGIEGWERSLTLSGSSLLTLGFASGDTFFHTLMAFSEATIGLILVALLIAYLPTMYSAFSRRELAVTLLEARAGHPPSPVEMLKRYQRIDGLKRLHETWQRWEVWFADVEESHTSLAALVFFRSPQPDQSWVTAAGTILDAAALTLAALDIPWEPEAALCIRSGFLALRRVADFFGVAYSSDPHFPDDAIGITRAEFDAAYAALKAQGLPVKPDREQAWLDFAGWRVNYDTVLVALQRLTMAPAAPWLREEAESP